MQRSQRVNALPDIHAPLFKRQKWRPSDRQGVKKGCVTMVMHEWLFLVSTPAPSLKDVEDMEWVECSRKARGGGCRRVFLCNTVFTDAQSY